MISINISGGLGNQMFQYSAGYALARRFQCGFYLVDDMARIYGDNSKCRLGEVFEVAPLLQSAGELRTRFGWFANPKIRRILAKPLFSGLAPNGMVFEPHFNHWPNLNGLASVNYLHGYWQCPRYFEGYEADIRRAFQFRGELAPADSTVLQMMRAQPSVAMHIRRGDYTNSKNSQVYVQLGRDYYKSAMRLMRDKISDPRFFVFSDDPNWVRQNIIDDDSMVLVDHNVGPTSFNDMRLMSLADHNIIANSTFSWWGAWLNANPGKVVIAPKTWFLSSKMDSSDVCPYDWIRL